MKTRQCPFQEFSVAFSRFWLQWWYQYETDGRKSLILEKYPWVKWLFSVESDLDQTSPVQTMFEKRDFMTNEIFFRSELGRSTSKAVTICFLSYVWIRKFFADLAYACLRLTILSLVNIIVYTNLEFKYNIAVNGMQICNYIFTT